MRIRVYIDGKFENVGTIVETRNSGQSYLIKLDDGRTFVRNKKFLRKYHGNSQSQERNNGVVDFDKKKAPSKQENTRVVGNDKKKALVNGNDAHNVMMHFLMKTKP